MKKIILKITAFICTMFLVTGCMGEIPAFADEPYTTYSYNYWGEATLQPHAYIYSGSFDSISVGEEFLYPQDMDVCGDRIVIADTNNSRVVVLNERGNLLKTIVTAQNKEDCLSKPQGVFIDKRNGHLYVADTGNARIVEYDENYGYLRSFGRPETELIGEEQVYSPTKVVVDSAGRIYVIAYGINMGLLEFNKDGGFVGFHGATEVTVNRFTYIWKNYFSTDAQKERMQTIVPTEYSNIFLDDKDFIYATISNLDDDAHMKGADAIRRLNPTGTDVLRRLGNTSITGDLYASSDDAEWSTFTDVCATEYGCYFILDQAGGKIFAYDYDGNSLFVFGDKGNREGATKAPTAIGINKDASKIYVLDSQLASVLVYEITDYGRHLLGAMEKNNRGDAEGSYAEWQEVLKANSNCELAYIGIGKTYLKKGEYKEAMNYFKLGNSKKYYSTAFYYYRRELMQEFFPTAMTVIGCIILLWFVISIVRKIRRLAGEIRCTMDKH